MFFFGSVRVERIVESIRGYEFVNISDMDIKWWIEFC